VDEVCAYKQDHQPDFDAFCADNNLDHRPVIALLAGSRKQEIKANLRLMAEIAGTWNNDYQMVVAAAPGIDDEFYRECLGDNPATLLRGQTYRILQHSLAALVTSGTATLETALFRVPQIVCYNMKAGRLANLGKKLLLKVPYISLVNLIASREVVPELVAADMNPTNLQGYMISILPGGSARQRQLRDYEEVAQKLGEPGAPAKTARLMTEYLRNRQQH
jgi:lipid-A-disaccharide synthase